MTGQLMGFQRSNTCDRHLHTPTVTLQSVALRLGTLFRQQQGSIKLLWLPSSTHRTGRHDGVCCIICG